MPELGAGFPHRWDKSCLQAAMDTHHFVPGFQIPSCKSIIFASGLDEIGMLNCEAPDVGGREQNGR